MAYALIDKPNPNGPHFYPTRRGKIKAIVMHVTAGLQDLDLIGADHSDQGLFNYLQSVERSVSWHSQSDSDSWRRNLPDSYTAFHCMNYNSTTVGHEICKRTADWRQVPTAWRQASLRQAAACIAPRAVALGVPLRRCTKVELDQAISKDLPPVGFIHHGRLDPQRRTDAGLVWLDGALMDTFPWDEFFRYCREVTAPGVPPFPLPAGHFFGRPRADPRCHSGYYSAWDRAQLQVWQRSLSARGSRVNTDGRFTLTTLAVVRWHQIKHGRKPNGLIGRSLWDLTI